MHLKYCLRKGSHFVQGEMSLKKNIYWWCHGSARRQAIIRRDFDHELQIQYFLEV